MKKKLILASGSPRRRELLQQAGYSFATRSLDVDESYPGDIDAKDVALYLAEKKAKVCQAQLSAHEVAITADTTVVLDNRLLEKANDLAQAKEFLLDLSGKSHQVITGVCVFNNDTLEAFSEITIVRFKALPESFIDFYVQRYKPLDKAGAYGIQEWIGMMGINSIEGSYHNVVGLPVAGLVEKLQPFEIYPTLEY